MEGSSFTWRNPGHWDVYNKRTARSGFAEENTTTNGTAKQVLLCSMSALLKIDRNGRILSCCLKSLDAAVAYITAEFMTPPPASARIAKCQTGV
jgi:hypothetical protein